MDYFTISLVVIWMSTFIYGAIKVSRFFNRMKKDFNPATKEDGDRIFEDIFVKEDESKTR